MPLKNKRVRSKYMKKWHSEHKDYRKNKHLQRKYGITVEEFNEFVNFCDNKCAICNKEELSIHPQSKQLQPLSLDHDHKLGHIRGLLCTKCNQGLGYFKDNIELLQNAITYLNAYKEVIEEINAINSIKKQESIQTQCGGGDVCR